MTKNEHDLTPAEIYDMNIDLVCFALNLSRDKVEEMVINDRDGINALASQVMNKNPDDLRYDVSKALPLISSFLQSK